LCFPRAYEDRWTLKTFETLEFESKVAQSCKVLVTNKTVQPRWNKKLYSIEITDSNGDIAEATYFNNYFQYKKIEPDARYIIVWKPKFAFGKIQFAHPEFIVSDENTTWITSHNVWRIFPVYAETMWIKSSWFAKNTRKALTIIPQVFHEYLPDDFLETYNLMWVHETIRAMHYPQSYQEQEQAMYRIFFDRLLRIQIYSMQKRQEYQTSHAEHTSTHTQKQQTQAPDRELIGHITSTLPFALTTAQKKVIKAIIQDFHGQQHDKHHTMMRLLQWDVWSWKTIVAVITARYIIKFFGGQVAFLVPLSVLAQQHVSSIAKILLPLGVRVALLSWKLTAKEKEQTKQQLANWQIDLIVWTHALLQDTVSFASLQYVIIDEQHKFWVKQRSFLKQHWSPHILQMSATPIPRSMALAFFGEFDVSVIDELPAWRKEITTKIVTKKDRTKLKPRIMQKIENWQKVFVVTPLVEESEKIDWVASAIESFYAMQEIFWEIQHKVWLMHGKMKAKEKDEIMTAFKSWKIMILVATTVIEVWVDIPEATIMIIQNAERFGLAQLHQLRGRIWRNDLQSYCFLETKTKSWDTYQRLKAMEQTSDWFKLADIDLQYRWTGEILGTRQSWISDIPLAIMSDLSFIEKVHEAAAYLLKTYPNLDELPKLKAYVEQKMEDTLV